MNTKKLFALSAVCVAASALFSLTTLSFHADISVVAFPLALVFVAVSAFFGVQKVFRAGETRFVPVLRELLQYLPYVLLVSFVLRRAGAYGTPAVLDAFSVLFWVVASGVAVVILHYLNPKRVETYIDGYKVPEKTKKSGVKWLALEAVSWIDALVQAVFMVLLLNIFIVQLYEIPSESMVPEFLIKDRVVVFKTLSGPKFPLSNIGLPYLKSYKRGDIVVFRNPHYDNDRKSEVKTFVSQLVYMISLTKVNLNMDEDGNPKADPLVKRLAGVPGEQLMMQDGILYHRTAASDEFTPVEDDATWAAWNLHETKSSLKNGIQQFPLSQSEYDSMVECERLRASLDLTSAALECRALSSRFSQLAQGFTNIEQSATDFAPATKDMFEYALFAENASFALKLLAAPNGRAWFSAFMTDWIGKTPDFAGNVYDEANYRLNLMIKLTLGRLVVRTLELLRDNVQPTRWGADARRNELMEQAQMLNNYVFLLDRRNMPVFPPDDADGNPQYIPANCYFMMGDNRFNSLDMRHSYDDWLAPLTPYDDYAVTYYTNMAPQYVHRSRILGTTAYRFWPLNRYGVPGHTGK